MLITDYMSTVVNRPFPSAWIGSHEITLTEQSHKLLRSFYYDALYIFAFKLSLYLTNLQHL